MPKRILLAEESDTIRSIAESLLRQNGYEVLSITSGEKSLEVLNFTRPDLIVLASDLKFKGNTPMYEKLQADTNTSGLPLLIMANQNEADLAYPPEVIVTKPFDPKEFLEKVNILSGSASSKELQQKQLSSQNNPLNESVVEEEFLDAALGLDRIDVTDSEVLNQDSSKITKKKTADVTSESSKVESLMIRDEEAEINLKEKIAKKENNDTGTGLDILDDQFGMIDKGPLSIDPQDSDHDYSWFLNELKNENSPQATKSSEAESQKLTLEDNSLAVDPITPVSVPSKKSTSSGSVDKFIDEFKKEIEKFSNQETESITIDEPSNDSNLNKSLDWQDSVESITPQQLEIFKKQFIKDLAGRIAEKIAEKIDSEKLLQLLKQEILNQSKKNK